MTRAVAHLTSGRREVHATAAQQRTGMKATSDTRIVAEYKRLTDSIGVYNKQMLRRGQNTKSMGEKDASSHHKVAKPGGLIIDLGPDMITRQQHR